MNYHPDGLDPVIAYSLVAATEGTEKVTLLEAMMSWNLTIGALLEEEWAVSRYNRFRESVSCKTALIHILLAELEWESVNQLMRWISTYRETNVDVVDVRISLRREV
jgi:hypothetical protein